MKYWYGVKDSNQEFDFRDHVVSGIEGHVRGKAIHELHSLSTHDLEDIYRALIKRDAIEDYRKTGKLLRGDVTKGEGT